MAQQCLLYETPTLCLIAHSIAEICFFEIHAIQNVGYGPFSPVANYAYCTGKKPPICTDTAITLTAMQFCMMGNKLVITKIFPLCSLQ